MNITICGSIAFYDEMCSVKEKLQALGHAVEIPPTEITDEHGRLISVKEYYERRKKETHNSSRIWDRKQEAMKLHFDKIAWCDAILVLNYPKHGVAHYIGANTLIEMGLALHLNKKIFLLNEIPDITYKEEILGMKPIILHDNLTKI